MPPPSTSSNNDKSTLSPPRKSALSLFWTELSTALHRKQVWIAIIIALLLIPTLSMVIWQVNRASISESIKEICSDRASSISASLSVVIAAIDIQVALRQAYPTQEIDSPDFKAMYMKWVNRTIATRYVFERFAYIRHITQDERSYFEDVFPNVTISTLVNQTETTAIIAPMLTNQSDYFVWLYNSLPGQLYLNYTGLELLTSNFSLDMYNAARSTGRYVARSSLSENRVDGRTQYWVGLCGVYFENESDVLNQSPDERFNNSYGVYRGRMFISTLVDQAFNERVSVPVLFEIYDQRINNTLVYSHFLNGYAEDQQINLYRGIHHSSDVLLSDVNWTLKCVPSTAYVKTHEVSWYWFFLLALLVIFVFFMAGLYLHVQYSKIDIICKEVGNQTAQLHEALVELNQAKDSSEFANFSKTKFMAFLCHELRNPLHSIAANASFLEDGRLSSEQLNLVQSLISSTSLMTNIVNDVLDLSKIENGSLKMEIKRFNIRHLVETACRSQTERCKKKNLYLTVNIENEVPQTIKGDPTRISQILFNLLSNAVKFTSQGGIHVDVRVVSQVITEEKYDLPEHQLEIAVTDSGIGMDKESFTGLFEQFSQEKPSTMRQFGGTGLGLSICKQLVTCMGGVIDVESEVGRGSKFIVRIALIEDDDLNHESMGSISHEISTNARETIPNDESHRSLDSDLHPTAFIQTEGNFYIASVSTGKEEIPSNEVSMNGLRILYADDQPINRMLMSRFFKNTGVQLVLVENGLEAVRSVQKALQLLRSRSRSPSTSKVSNSSVDTTQMFDVVLLDINMPVMDGKEAASIIRDLYPNIPIIAITANLIELDREDVSGFDEIAYKPLKRDFLFDLIRKHLSR